MALLLSLSGRTQTSPADTLSLSNDVLLTQAEIQVVAETDSLNLITLQRDPKMDAMVAYFRKNDPPTITVHPGENYRNFPDPTPLFSYYRIGGHRATVNNVEEYLGEVAPLSYKDFSRGRELGRKSGRWFYAGLGGFALMLTSGNRDIRRIGLGMLTIGTTISLGCAIAGQKRRRRALQRYNTQFH